MTISVPTSAFSQLVRVYPSAPEDSQRHASPLPQAREVTVTVSATIKAE